MIEPDDEAGSHHYEASIRSAARRAERERVLALARFLEGEGILTARNLQHLADVVIEEGPLRMIREGDGVRFEQDVRMVPPLTSVDLSFEIGLPDEG